MADKTLRVQVLETIAALMTAAFGFVAALAWNDAIQTTIKQYIGTGSDLPAKYIYAVIVTIIAVVMGLVIARAIGKAKKKIGGVK